MVMVTSCEIARGTVVGAGSGKCLGNRGVPNPKPRAVGVGNGRISGRMDEKPRPFGTSTLSMFFGIFSNRKEIK